MGITDHLPTPPRWLVLVFRAVQLLSALVSTILYAVFIARVATGSAGADRAVVGIAAAAVVWSISALIQQWWKRSQNSSGADGEGKGEASPPTHSKRKKIAIAVLMFLVLDLVFVGLMIASAAISGRRQSCQVPEMDGDDEEDNGNNGNGNSMYNGSQCGLQKGVLALSIVNM